MFKFKRNFKHSIVLLFKPLKIYPYNFVIFLVTAVTLSHIIVPAPFYLVILHSIGLAIDTPNFVLILFIFSCLFHSKLS